MATKIVRKSFDLNANETVIDTPAVIHALKLGLFHARNSFDRERGALGDALFEAERHAIKAEDEKTDDMERAEHRGKAHDLYGKAKNHAKAMAEYAAHMRDLMESIYYTSEVLRRPDVTLLRNGEEIKFETEDKEE